MKLVASRNLARHPWDLVRLPAGELLLCTFGGDGRFIEAYDPDLTLMWSVRLDEHPIKLLLDPDGTPWVLDRAGASAFGGRGTRVARIEPRVPAGTHISALARANGDFVFASHHDVRGPMLAPVVQRVRQDGTVGWTTTLPVGSVSHKGVVEMRRADDWHPEPIVPWTPKTWLSVSSRLDVSGDAVLACFSEMPRSGIGCGYVLSVADGTVRFTTTAGPISETAALGDGAFLVGYQGYGAFETLRYDRDGRVETHWASHGRYVIVGNDVRVMEMTNAPRPMNLARLLPDGSVARGDCLEGYHSSWPCLRADGTVLFFRNGALFAARDLAIAERLGLCAPNDGIVSTAIAAGKEGVSFALWGTAASDESPRLVRVDV